VREKDKEIEFLKVEKLNLDNEVRALKEQETKF
jgi:hypothetical protein